MRRRGVRHVMVWMGATLALAACAISFLGLPFTTVAAVATSIPAVTIPTPTTPPLDLDAEYPLSLGNTWVYQSTRYEGFNPSKIMTATSTITDTVVDIKIDPAYFAAKISEDTSAEIPIAGPPELLGLARPASTNEYWLIVAGNRIYHQDKDLDLTNLQSTDALELVFPLVLGSRWVWLPARLPTDDSTDGVYRQVLQVGTVQVPAGQFDNCLLIQDGWVTDTSASWFCPGVGWVEQQSDHNGTPVGGHTVLFRYSIKPESTDVARETLDRFMQARIGGQDGLVYDLLTDDFKTSLERHANDVWLLEASNPCWYRYQVIQFDQTNPTRARGRVRVYQHDWAGDVAGGPPQSWEQAIGLVETSVGWRVDQMDRPENQRVELSEPHGPTLSACSAQAGPTPPATPTVIPPIVQHTEFTALNEAIKAAPFTLLTPAYIPEDIPFHKAWVWEFEDGSQTVRLLYSPPTNDPHANAKTVDIQLTKTNEPFTLDSVTHQFREIALDVRQLQVRNTTGYTYWTPAVSMGNSAVLMWREGEFTMRVTLNGPWPEPSAENPHGLDSMLLKIAESLR